MFRISIPVKVVMVGGFTYAVTVLVSTLWSHPYFFAGQICVVLLSVVIATHYFLDRPLASLTEAMSKASQGDLLVRAEHEGIDEIGTFSKNFNEMLDKLTQLSQQKVQIDQDLIVAKEEFKYQHRLEETNKTLENLVTDLSLLYEIGQKINQTVELEQLYQVISDVLQQHLKLGNFSLMAWDDKNQLLQVRCAFGFDKNPEILAMTFRPGEGIAGEAVKTGKIIYVGEATKDPRFVFRSVEIFGSVLSLPLVYKGETLGVINFGRDEAGSFSQNDIKMLTLVGNQVALAMANAKLYTKTRELSVRDELTGVYNRRHFAQVMQLEWKRALRFKRELSLLMIDVDYFKRFNDTYGHLEGDKILKHLGTLLNQNLREVDTVARFGGEEFVILLPDTDKRGAIAVAEKLRHLVQEQIQGITVSVGVANFPDDVHEIDDLIDEADIALYDAKDLGRNQVITCQGREKKSEVLKNPQEEKEEVTTKTRIIH